MLVFFLLLKVKCYILSLKQKENKQQQKYNKNDVRLN